MYRPKQDKEEIDLSDSFLCDPGDGPSCSPDAAESNKYKNEGDGDLCVCHA